MAQRPCYKKLRLLGRPDLARSITTTSVYKARNCVLWVDEKLRVKVTDSALSRDLYPQDYHCLGDNENRPVKWLAYESLVHRTFSAPSDVWSFGVLLWELITLAQQPYSEVDPFEMAAYLRDGYRLAQPLNCPDQTIRSYDLLLDRRPRGPPVLLPAARLSV
ncbi:LOW QUALITY PROTEIN: tyrosine-protein kinase RYK-like [Homalodisca vitripennis]|uniref:LOW QUALITY PROTEIN: tyrosine-protein kinase RYK-like n=1 Tax=Homalodisca vitripennis TaxID=197043 RepID=UPI001EE9C828|nr:LOW QUALITY PROTEIN: tyrosine-protein kinase RYK-like [Homalodisca vitripennis]